MPDIQKLQQRKVQNLLTEDLVIYFNHDMKQTYTRILMLSSAAGKNKQNLTGF